MRPIPVYLRLNGLSPGEKHFARVKSMNPDWIAWLMMIYEAKREREGNMMDGRTFPVKRSTTFNY